jgi:hypothetical protein
MPAAQPPVASPPFPGVDNWMKSINENTGQPATEELPANVQAPPPLPTGDVDNAAALAAAARVRAATKPNAPTPEPLPKPAEPPPPTPADKAKEPPPPVAAEKPKETPPVTPTEPDKWPRTAQDWEKFKTVRDEGYKARDTQIQALQAEKTALEKKLSEVPQAPPDMEALKKERDELSETLKTVAVEKHPKFKQYYDTQIQNQIGMAKTIVGAENAAKIEQLLNMGESEYREAQLSEMLMELSALQQSRLGGVLNKLTELNTERQGEILKARDNYEQMQAKQAAESAQFRNQAEKQFDSIVSKLQASGDDILFTPQPGKDEWNAGVAERIKTAREMLFSGKIPKAEPVIQAALHAAAYPAVLTELLEQIGKVKSLEDQIKTMSAAAPRMAGQAPQGESPDMATNRSAAPKSGTRPMDVTQDWMKALPPLR